MKIQSAIRQTHWSWIPNPDECPSDRSDPVPVTGLLHPGSDPDTLLLLLLLADMPKKSVMDSKSAKWLRSVCSVAADLLIEEVTIGVTADLVVVAAVSETATSADVVS